MNWLFKQLLAMTLTIPQVQTAAIPQPQQPPSAPGAGADIRLVVVQEDIAHPQKYPEARARDIYWAVCWKVAKEVRPEHPERVMPVPVVELRLGAKKMSANIGSERDVEGGGFHWKVILSMPEWKDDASEDAGKEERFFAEGMALAAGVSVVKFDDLLDIGRGAQAEVDGRVSVEELKNGK